jgi:hypothetical protein
MAYDIRTVTTEKKLVLVSLEKLACMVFVAQ